MENQENRNNTLRDFLLSLYLIGLKEKKPPDNNESPRKADSASKVGDPISTKL